VWSSDNESFIETGLKDGTAVEMVGNTNLARDGKNVGEIGTDRGLVDDVHVDIETLTLILKHYISHNKLIIGILACFRWGAYLYKNAILRGSPIQSTYTFIIEYKTTKFNEE
jgi:hypothetical protein